MYWWKEIIDEKYVLSMLMRAFFRKISNKKSARDFYNTLDEKYISRNKMNSCIICMGYF